MSRARQATTCCLLALGVAVKLALFAPDGSQGAQLLTMLTPVTAVLLVLGFAPDAGWVQVVT